MMHNMKNINVTISDKNELTLSKDVDREDVDIIAVKFLVGDHIAVWVRDFLEDLPDEV